MKLNRIKRYVAWLLLLALFLSLIPLYGAALFSYPGVDDFRYGYRTHEAWTADHSLFAVFRAAWEEAQQTYFDWQGSYAAIFLMALEPGIFGENLYGLSTLLLLTALVLFLLFFVSTACRELFAMDRETGLICGALAAICCVEFLPSPAEGYYWFNGGVYYTFFFSLSCSMAALVMKRHKGKTTPFQWVALPVLAIFIGGGNLVTGLLCCGLFLLDAVWMLVKKKRDPLLLVTLGLLLLCFLVNALAPGNGVRQAEHGESAAAGPVQAILAAMGDAARFSGKWLCTPGPFLLLGTVPFLWSYGGEVTAFRFRWPLGVSVFSFLLLAAGFTPTEYALSMAGEARLINIQYDTFLLLFLLNLLWYTGWLRQHLPLGRRLARGLGIGVPIAGLILAGLLAVKTRDVASVSAVRILWNGNARSYGELWERRLTVLRDPGAQNVTLEKPAHQPPLLCVLDLVPDTGDENYWYNQQLERYYHKERILREP